MMHLIKDKLPFFFGRKKLFLSFEYGVVLSQVAQNQGVELTPEIIEKAERMIENEFKHGNPTRLAVDIIPNILSIFEIDIKS